MTPEQAIEIIVSKRKCAVRAVIKYDVVKKIYTIIQLLYNNKNNNKGLNENTVSAEEIAIFKNNIGNLPILKKSKKSK